MIARLHVLSVLTLLVNVGTAQNWHWNPANGPYGGPVKACIIDRGGVLYAGTETAGMYKTTTQDEFWIRCGLETQAMRMLAIDSSGSLLAASPNALFRSTNHGSSWYRVDTLRIDTLKKAGVGLIEALIADSAGRIVVATWGKGLYRSTADGTEWEKADSGIVNKNLRCLAAKDSTYMFAGGSDGLYRSTDAGIFWTKMNTGVSGLVHSVSVAPNGDILASIAGGVYKSADDGDTWMEGTIGLPGQQAWALATSPDATSYAGADTGGVYVSLDIALAVPGTLDYVPSHISLSQCYPNPFNPSTTLRYSLPSRTRVTITVHTLLGQIVATLLDGDEEAGEHEVQFRGASLASGVYLCRLSAGGSAMVRRLVLIR